MLGKILRSDIIVLLLRICVVFATLALCRVSFYIYNHDLTGSIGLSELWPLIKGSLLFDSVSVVYAYGLFIILSLLPFRFREKAVYQKILFWYYIIVSTVVIALNLTDAVYFKYTGLRLTSADMMFADNDNTLLLMGKFMIDNWFLVLLWTALVAAIVFVWRWIGNPVTRIRNSWTYFGVNLLTLAAVGLLCVAMVRGGGLTRDIRPINLNNANSYTDSQAKANMILSNPFCILRTMGKNISYRKYFSLEELNEIYTPYHFPLTEKDYNTPDLSGRNVIIFVMESFSAEHSALLHPELYPDGVGHTPFLDSLMRNGYYFPRAYANGRKSIDAMPSVLGSTPSFKFPFVTLPQSLGEGRQLPRLLSEQGYNTMFFCGSPHGSMGFDAYATAAGIRTIYDKDDYDARYPGNKDFDNYWGVWDGPFLDYMGEVLSETRQPFFSTVFTITSHHPYQIPAQYADRFPERETPIQKCVEYVDHMIELFFEKYADEEWMRNSVFLFVADHVSGERYSPETNTSRGNFHVLSFIYTPDQSLKGRAEHVFQQIDVMPTLLGLMRYDKPFFAFGRDHFNEDRILPFAINYYSGFQLTTDSISVLFDEEKLVQAYLTQDKMQEHNVVSADDPHQQELEVFIKAFTQQYYSHLERKQFTVPATDAVSD